MKIVLAFCAGWCILTTSAAQTLNGAYIMKFIKFIAIAATLLTSQIAKADCEEYIMKRFEEIRERATQVNAPEYASAIRKVYAVMGASSDERYAMYKIKESSIEYSVDMCELPVQHQDRIIAHELGHAVAALVYPKLAAEIVNKVHLHSEEVHEAIADQFGARMLENSLNHEIVAISEKACEVEGNDYFCAVARKWLYATTH